MRCPVTLLFNENKGICDWPDNVDCGNDKLLVAINSNDILGTLKTPKPSIPTEADYTTDEDCPDGISKSDDCFGFNACVGGMKWEMDCPQNLSKAHF